MGGWKDLGAGGVRLAVRALQYPNPHFVPFALFELVVAK